jgi:SET domain-containing protein
MKLARSKIHRWGVYATERIPAGRKVIEYTGERISRRETKRRADGTDLIYLFTLDAYWTLDGSVGGSGAEYINHSCEPNLVSRILKGHILYISGRVIAPGEELTIDYRFDKKVERVDCRCGAKNCRGTINLVD